MSAITSQVMQMEMLLRWMALSSVSKNPNCNGTFEVESCATTEELRVPGGHEVLIMESPHFSGELGQLPRVHYVLTHYKVSFAGAFWVKR